MAKPEFTGGAASTTKVNEYRERVSLLSGADDLPQAEQRPIPSHY
jgi:hypothetical protein